MKYLVMSLLLLFLSGCSSMSTQAMLTGYVVGQNVVFYTEGIADELKTDEEISSFENFESFEEK